MTRGGSLTAAGFLAVVVLSLSQHAASARPLVPENEHPWKAAEQLKNMELRPTEGGVQAIIHADGAMEHKVYVQDEPMRLVLDILNVRNPLDAPQPTPFDPVLSQVVSEELPMNAYVQGAYDKTFARIIFSLKAPVDYRIQAGEQQLVVDLTGKSLDPAEGASGVIASTSPDESADGAIVEGGEPGEPDQEDDGLTYIGSHIEPADIDPLLFFDTTGPSSDEYRLGPEDVVEIRVFELDQLNRTVRVSGDGTMDLPLIGSIPVRGLTPEGVALEVANRLRNRFVQDPQVSVFVKEFHSQTVSLLGAVSSPATYPLVGRRNLLQILADAGGLSPSAGNVLFVFRQSDDGRSARLSVPLSELLIQGNPRWNIWLRPGDIVSVPPEAAVSVSVLGAVSSPGVYKLPVGDGASVLNAVARAGGLSDRASKSGIQIKRRDASGEEKVLRVDLGDILSGKESDFVLQEGDVIVVKESFF
jgi:polysaccharide export outer membrane protein